MRLEDLTNPTPGGRITWDPGHFYSGRNPSSAIFVEGVNGRPHLGIDLAALHGAQIVSPGPGTIVHARWSGFGAGYVVTVGIPTDDAGLVYSRNLHCLDRFPIDEGDWVDTGEPIGTVAGSGGNHNLFHYPPHNHTELIRDDPRITHPSKWCNWRYDLHVDPEPIYLGTNGGHHEEFKMFPDYIRDKQADLNQAGFTDADGHTLTVDGQYGAKTASACLKETLAAASGGTLDVQTVEVVRAIRRI